MDDSYWVIDELDGEELACRPGNITEGLEFVCNVAMPVMGYGLLASGMWFLLLLYMQRRNRMILARYNQSAAISTFSFVEKVTLCIGMSCLLNSGMIMANGFGTMYPTTHMRGHIGDMLGESLLKGKHKIHT